MLGVNAETGAFFVVARDPEIAKLAKKTGLDRSLPASQRHGCDVFITHDEYAALPFFKWADGAASDALFLRHLEYRESYRLGHASDFPHPPGVEFMPFQRAGIAYCMARSHCLIGDEPGLGKTIQAIGVANEMEARKVLVICPASTRPQWKKETLIWSTIPRTFAYKISRSLDGVSPFAHYLIISYDLARRKEMHDALLALEYDLLVLDEAHYLKTTEARRTRAVFGTLRQSSGAAYADFGEAETGFAGALAERSKKVLALTGTPLPNRPRECYNLARHLCWDSIDWMSEDTFQRRYNPSFKWPSGKVEERRGHLPELRARLRCNFMVRRLQPQALPQLPKRRYELTYVEPNGAIRKVLKAESLLDIDPSKLDEVDMEMWGHVSTVRREMGIAKAPRVAEHTELLLGGGLEKVLLFAHHRQVIDILSERLAGYGVLVIRGGVTAVQKYQHVLTFERDPQYRILIGQLQAAGTGVDGLQKVCSHAVFGEFSWTMGDNEQCVRRLHRHLQTAPVLAQFLVAPGSWDDLIMGRAIDKFHTVHETLDAGED